ncbi:MAG: O-antigen ligase family protein [Proteobacteria bacterium]|nr:O-antigen ligase family protein [Pseudomonadota bacterium]
MVFAITLIGIVVFDRSRAIRSRVLASFCFIPLFLLIFSTQSRATFGALIVGLAIVFANRKKVFLFFLIIVAVAVMYSPVKNRFYAMYDSPPDIRLAMTLTAIEVVKDYPITGIGYGHGIYYSKIDVDGYSNRLPERYRPKTALYKEPHNGPINIAVKTGIVGLALYLGIIVIFLKICIHLVREGKSWFVKNYARAVLGGFVSFLFTGLFEPAYAYVPTGVFFLILSMGTILDRLNREENEAIK